MVATRKVIGRASVFYPISITHDISPNTESHAIRGHWLRTAEFNVGVRFANLPADNLTPQDLSPPPDQYWSMKAYNNAKLCNVLFASKLAKVNKIFSAFDTLEASWHFSIPGNLVSSNLSRNWWVLRLFFALVRPFTKSLQQAAATTIYCATANELTGLNRALF
ncbi:hypothetical protein DOY81_010138 [Sarcophaga bullata]|nr:hypothetical protein DOY81_010138 [Sarcophaga bullata]